MLAETFLNMLEIQPNDQYWFNHILKSPRLAAVQIGMFSRGHVTSITYSAKSLGCHAPQLPDDLAVAHFQVGHKVKGSLMMACGLWALATTTNS